MNKTKLKICGIKNINTLQCCIENNVDFFGMIFYEKSPRHISFEKALNLLKYSKEKKISSVGVFVNKNIEDLNQILKKLTFNIIQLHGNEDNDYIKYIKKNNDIKIIKVIPMSSSIDLEKIPKYSDSDFFLFDYKPIKKELPGGNSKKFDWKLLKCAEIGKPWFLSGGINKENINDIKKYAIPYGIDISSGVEVSPGIKSNEKIISIINLYDPK